MSSPPLVVTSSGDDVGLAKLWEADLRIRERLRFNDGKLLVWPKNKQDKELVGQPSMQALAINCHIMTIMAAWWCPTQKSAKTPSIQIIKNQVPSNDEKNVEYEGAMNCYFPKL